MTNLNLSQKNAIDGLRGFLALWVFSFHFNDQNTVPFFGAFFSLGWYAVSIFFVISGFLVSRSFSTLAAESAEFVTLKFYLKRLVRIWPAWCAALFLYAYMHGGVSMPTFVYNFLLLFGFQPFKLSQLMVYVSWSLFAEEMFYLFYPLIFIVVRAGGLIPLTLLSFWGPSLFNLIFPDFNIPDGYDFKTPFNTFSFFLTGVCFNQYMPSNLNRKNTLACDFIVLIMVGALILNRGHDLIEMLGAVLLFTALYSQGAVHYVLSSVFRFFGPRCFTIYLLHPLALEKINQYRQHMPLLTHPDPMLDIGIHFTAALVLTLVYSEILHQCVEKPFIRLGAMVLNPRLPNKNLEPVQAVAA